MKILVQFGANVGPTNDLGYTALHTACAEGKANAVAALVDMGKSNLEAKDYLGRTPLHLACKSGKLACVKALLVAGAEKSASTNKGESVLDIAKESKQQAVIKYVDGFGKAACIIV